MIEITLGGKQNFMGREIPVVYGGFGEGKKCVSDKTIAEIHKMQNKHVRERISENIKRFKENVDFIDLKQRVGETGTLEILLKIGYAKQSITQAEHIYILSERGYAKLIKIMDTDLAWEVHDKLIDEYFAMREIINFDEQLKAKLLLSIYKGGQESILAAKGLTEIEVNKAMAPLILENTKLKPKAEYHDNVLNNKELIATTVIAKDLGLNSASKLNKIMSANRIIFKNKSGTWCPYAKYEWLITERYADYKSYEDERTKPCLKWTEKGRKWIIENFDKWSKVYGCA
ncbi:MAG: hypothetical protein HFE59_11510 [Clostridiales bacterium]|nr:hypothetical protein [Clostridiales bacterium]